MKKLLCLVFLLLIACMFNFSACNYGNNHVHAFDEWTTVKNANCTEAGINERYCSCGEKQTQTISAFGHTEIKDDAIDATCTTTGMTEGKHCSVCNAITIAQTEIKAFGHTEVIDAAIAATCTTDGKTEGKHCSVCNVITVAQTKIKAFGHTEVIVSAVAATCTTEGKTEGKHCSVCNAITVAQTEIKAFGHTEVIDAAIAATCTTDGKTEGKHCSVCNAITVAQTKIKAFGHTEVIDAAIAATCTTDGKTEGKHCSVCNENLIAQINIPAKHTNGEWITDIDATCTEDGFKHQVCSICDATIKTETLTKLGHTNGKWIINKEATCTIDGQKTQQCEICETILSTNVIQARHSYTITQTLPTCLSNGSTTIICTKCSETYTEEWTPITFSIKSGYYYLEQGSDVIYYLELVIQNIQGGVVQYDENKNKIPNEYSITIYNTATQEITTFKKVLEKTGRNSSKYYSHVFDGTFMIYISDGYSTYTYSMLSPNTEPVLYEKPYEHHLWNSNICNKSATCTLCNENQIIKHVTVNGICTNCKATTYMPKLTSPSDFPIEIKQARIDTVSFCFSPYTSSDGTIYLNIQVKGFKRSTNSLIGFTISIYDNSSGVLFAQRNEAMGSEVEAGEFIRNISCKLVKSGHYRIVITSYF